MIICSCANINDRQVRETLVNGSRTLADVQLNLGAAMGCGRCRAAVSEEIARFYGSSAPQTSFCPTDLAPTN